MDDINTNIDHTNKTLSDRDKAGVEIDDASMIRLIQSYLFFYNYKYIDKTQPLLDIGAREGWMIQFLHLAGFSNLTAIDICPTAVNLMLDKGINAFLLDVQGMPFNEEFGIIIAAHVIEHCSHPEKAIQLIHNALWLSGILYLEVPLEDQCHPERSAHFTSFPDEASFFDILGRGWEILKSDVLNVNAKGTKKNLRCVLRKI